jgi:hypothetical protein
VLDDETEKEVTVVFPNDSVKPGRGVEEDVNDCADTSAIKNNRAKSR